MKTGSVKKNKNEFGYLPNTICSWRRGCPVCPSSISTAEGCWKNEPADDALIQNPAMDIHY
jgi:hypothetical protein